MAKTRRNYTEEFKIEAVRLYERTAKTQEDVEEELGIGAGCLSRWKKRYGADADKDELQEQTAQATRIRQLERENEILRQEREILTLVLQEVPGKKQSPSSRNQADEVSIHRGSSGRVSNCPHVQGAGGVAQWLLCLARSPA